MQKRVFRVAIFIPEKYVFRVCFESPFTRMISNLNNKCPPTEKFVKNQEKEGKNQEKKEKSGRKGKNREGSFT